MASKLRSTDDSVVYDIIIVGGGPIGLASAYECAVNRNMKVLLLEQFTFHNTHCSSPGYSRQWRICYSQKDLTELAIQTRDKWLQLIKETANEKLVKFTGVLWFGYSEISTPEGNNSQAVDNLQALKEPYKYYDNAVEIRDLFPFIRGAVPDNANITALFLEKLGGSTINVPELVDSLKKKLENSIAYYIQAVSLNNFP